MFSTFPARRLGAALIVIAATVSLPAQQMQPTPD